MNQPTSDVLTGIIERITFYAEESGYGVARLKVPKSDALVTITGKFAQLQAGQTLRLEGQWHEHPQYGSQFQVAHYQEMKPATLTGIEKYLGSGLIKGVGPVTAKRIVKHFGLETLTVIESDINKLIQVPGIGQKRVRRIQRAWAEQQVIKEVMVFLQGHGVSTTYAVKIFKHYGPEAISTVRNNPYQLADDIYGIGFLTADRIAREVGISPWSKYRYQSGVLQVLSQAAEEGHCFLPQPQLRQMTMELLSFDGHQAERETVDSIIETMGKEESLVRELAEGDMPLCYHPAFFHTERHLTQLLIERMATPIPVDMPRVQRWLERFTQSRRLSLSTQQQQAVEMAVQSRVMVLTGGPGTGKTFCTHTIVSLWKAMGKQIGLAAPTGRAAQRLSEMTGLAAQTLHRLLEFSPTTRGFKRGQDNPLPYDALVVDESSMLDIFLAHALFKALAPEAQILLVGDVDQLPSVGPGKILADLIDSELIPVVRLSQVFRQAQNSGIIRAAHQINRGQYPLLETIQDQPQSDCLWHPGGTDPEHGLQVIRELLQDFLPQQGINPTTEVQVLSPMTRGAVGTRNLNGVLQQLINPPHPSKAEVVRGGMTFRVGDRVIQLKNNYDLEVFNGDLGIIKAIDTVEHNLTLEFEGRNVSYDYADLNEITLAWSITIHKSQGSEYPVVLLPIYMSHYIMLSRNLIYTGLTRAKQLAIVIGPKKAIALAINQVNQQQRYSRLVERLQTKFPALRA